MKSHEMLILSKLVPLVQDKLDSYQVAYRHGRTVEDAVATLLHLLTSHLDTPGTLGTCALCGLFERI